MRVELRWVEADFARAPCLAGERFCVPKEPDFTGLEVLDVRVRWLVVRLVELACEADERLPLEAPPLFFLYVRSFEVIDPLETTLREVSYKQ